jgi:hypothetical protein
MTDRRRRLLIHAGPPKTATSAIQNLLWVNRASLRDEGILYPDRVASPRDPRHMFVQQEMAAGRISPVMKEVIAEADRLCCHSIVLSSEGIAKQLCTLEKHVGAEFMRSVEGWDVEFVFVLREINAAKISLFRQHIVNPPKPLSANPLERLHATGRSFRKWERCPEIDNMLNPDVFRSRINDIFEGSKVSLLDYDNSVVSSFCALLACSDLPVKAGADRRNVMPPDEYIEVLRRVNALPFGWLLNESARASIARCTDSKHLTVSRARWGGRFALRLLHAVLGRLRYYPPPPLDITGEQFDAARIGMQRAVSDRLHGRTRNGRRP